jgi:hypothetical protein
MADIDIPKFKTYAEGEPIPPVDPEDIKRMHEYQRTQSRVGANGCEWLQGLKAALSPEAEFSDVSSRHGMIETLTIYKLLTPWQHGEDLHEAVFRIAATIPFRCLEIKSYMIAGDERFGFDPNAFVQQLVDETGISHVWEPVPTKIAEGGRTFSWSLVGGARERDPDAAAKHAARQILWELWKRFSPSLDEIVSHSDKEQATHIVATFFANFLLDNVDLVRQLEDAFKDMQHVPMDPILSELERRAQQFPGSK